MHANTAEVIKRAARWAWQARSSWGDQEMIPSIPTTWTPVSNDETELGRPDNVPRRKRKVIHIWRQRNAIPGSLQEKCVSTQSTKPTQNIWNKKRPSFKRSRNQSLIKHPQDLSDELQSLIACNALGRSQLALEIYSTDFKGYH